METAAFAMSEALRAVDVNSAGRDPAQISRLWGNFSGDERCQRRGLGLTDRRSMASARVLKHCAGMSPAGWKPLLGAHAARRG